MNILSYRGPGKSGGVSGALSRLRDFKTATFNRWWYLSNETLTYRTNSFALNQACSIPSRIVEGHYRYCNNFLWPILHDLPERAIYSAQDRDYYKQFNLALALNAWTPESESTDERFFVQDYQLAFVPQILAKRQALVNVFWHVPWPRKVTYVPEIIEIAEALLSANKLGFHTNEYATNFMTFAQRHLAQITVDFTNKRIFRTVNRHNDSTTSLTETKIVVHPLGIDLDFWGTAQSSVDKSIRTPFVLSVDRADYTKGVLERIWAIEHFFADNPGQIGEITFVQICQPSRVGLSEFDKYWTLCRDAAQALNARWANNSWQPLIWIEDSLPPDILSTYYANASGLLVTSIRDGLNLTAKEFVACSSIDSVLLLSPHTGVWDEFKDHAMCVEPTIPRLMAHQIASALKSPAIVRREKMSCLKSLLQANPLDTWWQEFTKTDNPIGNVARLTHENHYRQGREDLASAL